MVATVEKKSMRFIYLFGIPAILLLIALVSIRSKDNFIYFAVTTCVITISIDKLFNELKKETGSNQTSKVISDTINSDFEIEKRCLDGLLSHDYFIVDSNIWMEPKYTYFFEHLKYRLIKLSKKAVICDSQIDEICNIKTKTDHREEASTKARYAINLIKSFQKDNILDIKGISGGINKNAYADPEILKLLNSVTSNNETIAFVTDDIELRNRAREIIKGHSMESQKIVEIENEFNHLLDEKYCPHILDC
jgi:hypothetical protein